MASLPPGEGLSLAAVDIGASLNWCFPDGRPPSESVATSRVEFIRPQERLQRVSPQSGTPGFRSVVHTVIHWQGVPGMRLGRPVAFPREGVLHNLRRLRLGRGRPRTRHWTCPSRRVTLSGFKLPESG